VLCVLVVVAWGMSMMWTIAWGQVNGMAVRLSGLTEGCAGTVIIRIRPINVELTNLGPRGLTVTPWTPARSPRGSRFGICLPTYGCPWWDHVWIPLWIPFVLLAFPTALLWWRDRKPPRGHCQRCGYNLTGNLSGVCPDCGEPT